jgi:hypothetical protein
MGYTVPRWRRSKERRLVLPKYGEFVITPALMMGMDDVIIDRIAFGGVKELEELYQEV